MLQRAETCSGADLRPDVDQLRKERELERLLEKRDTRRPARAALEPDDPLDRLHVAEPPKLEALLDVDELLAEVVLRPVLLRVLVDALEHRRELGRALVRLRDVAIEEFLRNGVAATGEIAQELVV